MALSCTCNLLSMLLQALLCAKDLVGRDGRFVLALGHHLYRSFRETSCIEQLISIYRRLGTNIMGLKPSPGNDVEKFGVVSGTLLDTTEFEHDDESVRNYNANNLISITKCIEKPTYEFARSKMRIVGRTNNGANDQPETFMTAFGLYIISGRIFEVLEDDFQNSATDSNGAIGIMQGLTSQF